MHITNRTSRALLGGASALALATAALTHVPQARQPAQTKPVRAQATIEPVLAKRVITPRPASRDRRLARPTGALPVGDLPGWKQYLRQDFRTAGIPAGWGTYQGRPGGNSNGWWAHDHVAVRGDDLHLVGDWQDGTFVTGGLMANAFTSTYGKYEVRFKVSKAHGVKYALLLWPATGSWPSAGEIDFAEDGGGRRNYTTATLHYGASNSQVQHRVAADFSEFQTVGVEWTPGKIVYTLNGRPWGVVTGSKVPDGPMNLALQLEAGPGTSWSPGPTRRTTPSTVDLVIDWVVGYRRA